MTRMHAPRQPDVLSRRTLNLARIEGPTVVRSVCLYTCSANPSGMGIHMLALARHLVENGVRVTVMYWPAPQTEALMSGAERLGAALVRTPHPRDPSYAAALRDSLRVLTPDVLHVHVGTGREDFGAARAARAAGVPAVVETLHLPWMMRSPRKRRAFFASLDAVDRLIAVSEGLRGTYERIGVPSERFATVPNGVVSSDTRPGRAVARRRLGLEEHRPVAMAVGRLAVQKGHVELVHALPALVERFPDLVAVIVGEGHLRDRLHGEADRLGVGRALLLPGHRADARELLDAADVFVLPSRGEGMPMAALEAMDAGLPVVATRVVGTEEVVQDGHTGFLVPRQDASAIASAVGRLIEDEKLRRVMGEEGNRAFHGRFTAARMTADTLAVYGEVLARTGPGR